MHLWYWICYFISIHSQVQYMPICCVNLGHTENHTKCMRWFVKHYVLSVECIHCSIQHTCRLHIMIQCVHVYIQHVIVFSKCVLFSSELISLDMHMDLYVHVCMCILPYIPFWQLPFKLHTYTYMGGGAGGGDDSVHHNNNPHCFLLMIFLSQTLTFVDNTVSYSYGVQGKTPY